VSPTASELQTLDNSCTIRLRWSASRPVSLMLFAVANARDTGNAVKSAIDIPFTLLPDFWPQPLAMTRWTLSG